MCCFHANNRLAAPCGHQRLAQPTGCQRYCTLFPALGAFSRDFTQDRVCQALHRLRAFVPPHDFNIGIHDAMRRFATA